MVGPRKQTHRSRAVTADQANDEFLDVAGHDLRTPITALKGHVQLLQRRLRKQGDRDQDIIDLNKMIYQVERLNHQLDVYLAASHITRRKFAIAPSETDLTAIVRRVLDVYKGGTTGHTFTLDAPDEPVTGTWDRRRIEQAFTALLNNAVKFSADGSIIEVRVHRDPDIVRLEVSDRGVGVPPAERRRIFEPSTHGSNVENAGPGLGLHVAREAIRRQGGRIGVRARRGGGSTFWVTLPPAAISASELSHQSERARTE